MLLEYTQTLISIPEIWFNFQGGGYLILDFTRISLRFLFLLWPKPTFLSCNISKFLELLMIGQYLCKVFLTSKFAGLYVRIRNKSFSSFWFTTASLSSDNKSSQFKAVALILTMVSTDWGYPLSL